MRGAVWSSTARPDGNGTPSAKPSGARIDIETVLAVYSIPRISQVQVIFRARLASPDIAAGPESEEVGLVVHSGASGTKLGGFLGLGFLIITDND